MSNTIIERALATVLDEIINPDPYNDRGVSEAGRYLTALGEYMRRLQYDSSSYGWHAEVIFQAWEGQEISIYEAFAFAKAHAMFYKNKIASRRILVGSEPFADAEVERNQQALQQIRGLVSATFWGGTQNEDGSLTVCREINAEFIGPNAPNPIPIQGSYPLEVGYTSPQKTLHYLQTGPGLARWPYGSKDIYVLHVIDGEKNGI